MLCFPCEGPPKWLHGQRASPYRSCPALAEDALLVMRGHTGYPPPADTIVVAATAPPCPLSPTLIISHIRSRSVKEI